MSIHSCGYHCHIPACIKAQRDWLRDQYVVPVDDRPVPTDAQLNELHNRLGGRPLVPTYNESKVKV
jgi:hypothetical protein